MNIRENIKRSLAGQEPERIPMTVYSNFLTHIEDVDSLLQRGMGVVERGRSWKIEYVGVETFEENYVENGKQIRKIQIITPEGELSAKKIITPGTVWNQEYFFKSEEDYPALNYLLDHKTFVPAIEDSEEKIRQLSRNWIFRDQLPLEPLQEFISGDIMDMETYSYEWMDNRENMIELAQKNAKSHRAAYEIVKNGPAGIVNYGGNVVPQVIGRENFQQYYVKYYDEAAKVLHESGKLLGTHLDGDNLPVMQDIRDSHLDYIEAYDPSVSPDMRTAAEYFGNKILWINWPSGEHFRNRKEAAEITEKIVKDWGTEKRLLVGVTEDMPDGKWDELLHGILDGLGYPKI